MTQKTNRRLALALLTTHAALLAWSGYRHSPTVDEPAHLAAGISHWKYGIFDLYAVNPPLVRVVAALPVLFASPELRWAAFSDAERDRGEFRVGEAFADANGARIFWLMAIARWACIPFSLLGGWVCFRWASELFGDVSGLAALSLWCFSPTILGNGALITADVPAAALCVTVLYLFWKWLAAPSWSMTAAVGSSLGIGLLTKSSLIVLLVILPVLWALARFFQSRRTASEPAAGGSRGGWRSRRRELAHLPVQLLVALLVLNLGYAFEGSGRPLGDYRFRSAALRGTQAASRDAARGNRFEDSWWELVPVPLPENFLIGIDVQKSDFERGLRNYFLGEVRTDGGGWWWFYLYAIAVKVPLGTLALALLALPKALNGKPADQALLVLPALFFLTLVSSQIGINFFRYLLPAFPFAFVWISQAFADWRSSPRQAAAAGIALSASVSSSLLCFPHSLSYFNELVGGPKNGYRIMADSNVDWGQDLIYLKEWIERTPSARGLNLSYYGPVDPILAGLDVSWSGSRHGRRHARRTGNGPKRQPQWEAVSVTHLAGQHGLLRKLQQPGDGDQISWRAYLYNVEPDVRIGYSIHVYRVAR